MELRISQPVQELLRCPVCHAKLRLEQEQFICLNSECNRVFPIVNGIPILLNEKRSVFATDNLISKFKAPSFSRSRNRLKKTLSQFVPTISMNIKGDENLKRLSDLLFARTDSPRVLVIGGGKLGEGMEILANNPKIELVETDVAFGTRTLLIVDAHDIPFDDGSFDAVVIQAVLEHVVDPYRCVDEIYRVLNEKGIVYAETPFMQQVHGGRYDFTRFSHLGHRRLFRWFEEIQSGAVCGPGMALAWSYQYFIMSLTASTPVQPLAYVFARFTSFYLKYFDRYLIDKPGTLDSASALYFIGRKAEQVLSDQELITLYKGVG